MEEGAEGARPDFGKLEVVAFESRRAQEMATLISTYGGIPIVAPSIRETPLEDNPVAFAFAQKLFAGELDAVIFTTGIGTQTLVAVLESRYPRAQIAQALAALVIVARGPKPVKVLRELQVPITVAVSEPHTWREILRELDKQPRGFQLAGSRVAVQEYGVSNVAFLEELRRRGADVLHVPVYRWTLPEDLGPLRKALVEIVEGRARVILFTNAAQVSHVMQVAAEEGLANPLQAALRRSVVCSVGPTCSESLLANGIGIDVEPEHPKMGILVREAAARAADLLRKKP